MTNIRANILILISAVCLLLAGCTSALDKAIDKAIETDGLEFSKTLGEFDLDPKQDLKTLGETYNKAIQRRSDLIAELKAASGSEETARLRDVIELLRLENDVIEILKTSFRGSVDILAVAEVFVSEPSLAGGQKIVDEVDKQEQEIGKAPALFDKVSEAEKKFRETPVINGKRESIQKLLDTNFELVSTLRANTKDLLKTFR